MPQQNVLSWYLLKFKCEKIIRKSLKTRIFVFFVPKYGTKLQAQDERKMKEIRKKNLIFTLCHYLFFTVFFIYFILQCDIVFSGKSYTAEKI
jgi:hypothetical protein